MAPFYESASCQMEKWSKIVYFIITRVVPVSVIWAKVIVSFCVYYFSSDSGDSALVMPTPTWCVSNLFKSTNWKTKFHLYVFRFLHSKVSIWLEKSDWIFLCGHNWIFGYCPHVLLCRKFGNTRNFILFNGYSSDEGYQAQLMFNKW